MSRKATFLGAVGERGLGMELRHFREKAGMSLQMVGSVLGWSANTLSRLERGLRPDTTTEEVSALLAAIKVVGEDRDRIMRMAGGYITQGWWEGNNANLTDQARTYLKFETRATQIVNVEPLLVPGLLQTPDYMHALMIALGVNKSMIIGRIARRLGRQELLVRPDPPDLVFVLCERSLRDPMGGYTIMARQIQHIADQGERPNVSLRIIPTRVVAHPGLHGAFVMLEFGDEPTVVHIEGRGYGMFPEQQDVIEEYRLAAERSMDLALAESDSLELLHAIAGDLEKARERDDRARRVDPMAEEHF